MQDETAKTDTTVPAPAPERLPNGQFPPGVSGNPAGRAKGTKNAITLARLMLEETLRESLTKAGPKLMHKAIRMALKGDDKIMRVLLDKMLATPRGDDSDSAVERDIQIVIQNLTSPDKLLKKAEGSVVSVQYPSRGKTESE